MLDHHNICWTVDSLREALGFAPDRSRIVSYLPMAHIAERITTHYSGIAFAYEVTTCADIRLLGAALAETRPQILFGVPRTFEKIHSTVQAVLAADPDEPRCSRRRWRSARAVAEHRARGEALSVELAAEYEKVDAESLRPARQLLGLDDLRVAVTSAAPIPVEVLQFFRSAGVPLSELYGMSESTGPMTWDPMRVKPGTVGRAIPGMEVRLADDGEVIGRGGNVFRGYLERSRAHRRDPRRRRVAPHRRHRRVRRRGLPPHRRPQEGAHHHRRRQERVAGQPRGGAQGAAADRSGVRGRRRRALHGRAARARSRRRARVGGEQRRDRHDSGRAGARSRWCWPRSSARSPSPTSASRTPRRSASSRCCPTSGSPTPKSSRPR